MPQKQHVGTAKELTPLPWVALSEVTGLLKYLRDHLDLEERPVMTVLSRTRLQLSAVVSQPVLQNQPHPFRLVLPLISLVKARGWIGKVGENALFQVILLLTTSQISSHLISLERSQDEVIGNAPKRVRINRQFDRRGPHD
jgi:hypothetical protein